MVLPLPHEPRTLLLPPHGPIPNNARLPALIYSNVLPKSADLASAAEHLLTTNGWRTEWRDVVLPYDHYHSTAHEALAVVAGEGQLALGGVGGPEVAVRAGDVLVLPAGFGHRGGAHSADFLLAGGYPLGQQWDLLTDAPDAVAQHRIDTLPFPASDPVYGVNGPLVRLWTR